MGKAIRKIKRAVAGAAAGMFATIAMSAVMGLARRAGLMGKHPPEEITERALDAVGARPDDPVRDVLAAGAHLAFGIGAGAFYGLLPFPQSRRGRILSGAGYGLAIWASSYVGWVPALRLMPPPTEDRMDRQAIMAASHVVYGATLGALSRARPLR
jgi:hypothetical protein